MKKSWARLVLDRLNSYVKVGGGEEVSGEGSSGVWEVGEYYNIINSKYTQRRGMSEDRHGRD
jgi:hypothetical protein